MENYFHTNCLSTSDDLRIFSRMSQKELAEIDRVIKRYPMRIPLAYFSLIDQSDTNDPIAKMCVPSIKELDNSGSTDTSGENSNTALAGVQHKYQKTALILTTNVCAMYCRHCFRKRMVGITDAELNKQVDTAVQYVKDHPEINNVLLSGGDALMLPNSILRRYLAELTSIDSLDFIRIGSRVPVVLPQRISADNELLDILSEYREKKTLFLVTQFNHPRELGRDQMEAIQCFLQRNIQVRNQTVLLRGINDNASTLGALLHSATKNGIAPYYVFQCRPARGVVGQFQVPLLEGIQIVSGAKSLQNGLGKSFRYVMSHPRGKIEILGMLNDNRVLFQFHQSKSASDEGRIFIEHLSPQDTWLDDALSGI